MKIWLDDIRPAPEGWVWIKNGKEMTMILSRDYSIEEISLDHDLGEDSISGYEILEIIETKIAVGLWLGNIPIFRVHSMNPVGRKNMERAIESIKRLIGEDFYVRTSNELQAIKRTGD